MEYRQDWMISVAGYGEFLFHGTEKEAEEARRHKARWEGAVARKRLATKEEAKAGRERANRKDTP